mmetsp:Transcript_96211/g.272397  ORF Transcript_96211/g.272397 Transcript_96211/m.272397 type:complete len:95 (+) Transcript_96211:2-286(+)
MQTVQEQVAHETNLKNVFKDQLETEEEVMFLGKDAYVPRLVATNIPLTKPKQGASGENTRESYAQPPASNRPKMVRGDAEPHVFPPTTKQPTGC